MFWAPFGALESVGSSTVSIFVNVGKGYRAVLFLLMCQLNCRAALCTLKMVPRPSLTCDEAAAFVLLGNSRELTTFHVGF